MLLRAGARVAKLRLTRRVARLEPPQTLAIIFWEAHVEQTRMTPRPQPELGRVRNKAGQANDAETPGAESV